jgi:hypothetical protein
LESGLPLIRELKATSINLKDIKFTDDVEELFIKKLRACVVVFDFSNDNNKYLEEKDIKRKTLLELITFMDAPMQQRINVLNEKVVKEIIEMVAINIFRTPKYYS